MQKDLNDMMSLDGTIVRIAEDGTASEYRGPVCAPEVHAETDDDGQMGDEHDAAMVAYVERQGWAVQTGWTGQHGYGGPIMHQSEFIGGGVEEHIRETPGLWCALPVEVESEGCPNDSDDCKLSDPCVICVDGAGRNRGSIAVGWIFMHRELPGGGE